MIGSRGYYIMFSVCISSVVTYFFPTAIASSTTALEAIIAIFSILAGVLVAVITIVGDPSMLLPGNWRLGYEDAKDVQKKIGNYANLIALYIVDLFFVVISILIKDANIHEYDWVFAVVTWISLLGFMLSVPLPYSLMAIQKARMIAEINRRQGS